RIRGFGNVLDGYGARRDATQFRTIEVRGQRKQPGGKDGILAPLGEGAVGQIYQWPLPAADDPLKRRNVACQDSFDIGLIVARAHAGLCLNGRTRHYHRRLHYFKKARNQKNATGTAKDLSYSM